MSKKIIRHIKSAGKYDSCRNFFKELKILTIPSLYVYCLLCYTKQNYENFTSNNQIHNHDTRNKTNLRTVSHRTTLFSKGARYTAATLYNKLPTSLKSSKSMGCFKMSLKQMLLRDSFYSVDEFMEACNCKN